MTVHSGFVSVVGRPNVGKSTLVNRLVGTKVAITSSRPQTTRNTIRGVLTLGEPPSHQLVLVDTPGLHKPRTALGARLNELVHGSLAEADAVLLVLDATQPIGPGDRLVAERSTASGSPVVVAVNKTDAAHPDAIGEMLAEAGTWDCAAWVPVSARTGDGVSVVVDELVPHLPEGPLYFPPDQVTDQPDAFLIREIIREKYLDRLREELPHSLAVEVRDLEQRPNGTLYVDAALLVERDSQKGIVIGRKGELLRTCGEEARRELETRFGTPVYLDLRVRVEKNWQDTPVLWDRLGFE